MQNNKNGLKRSLQNRHIQLIALGGAIGTGLFMGSAPTIAIAGPSITLGYLIAGLIAFLIMRHLGEMLVEEPVAGSFSYFAHKYWGEYPGFLAGWNYWILYILIGIVELTAAAGYMQHWFPAVPTFVWAFLFFITINAINMLAVYAFGEMEFWFAIIKIVAIVLMCFFGIYLIASHTVEGATLKNLIAPPVIGEFAGDPEKGGFFPFGIKGFIAAIPIIIFSFGGLELVGVTAAETSNPKIIIPKAINQIIYRILIFYVGTFVVLLSLTHWAYLDQNQSPFIFIFQTIGFKHVAGVLNFILITAALSVYNSCVYSNSRMLFGLAAQNDAPSFFAKIDKRFVPMRALYVSSFLTFLVVPLNLLVPKWQTAFNNVLAVVVASCIINWFVISMSHLKFKKQAIINNKKSSFPAIIYPYGNYIVFMFIFFVIMVMYFKHDNKSAVYSGIIWIGVTYIWFRIKKLRK